MRYSKKLVLVFAGVVLVLLVFVFLVEREKPVPVEKEVVKEEVQKAPEVAKEADDIKKVETKKVFRKKVRPPAAEEEPPEPEQLAFQKREQVKQFFDYLDTKDYVRAYELEEGSYRHFLKLLSQLSSTPPVVSGEMKDVYVLTRNIAHFCRVIKKRNISLVKDVLYHEKDITEPTMELFYEWIQEEIEAESGEVDTSLEQLYEYAAFFLNTVAGKAYLLRRDSKTRMLLIYYSILIIDRADRENLNRYGVDFFPVMNLLLDDLSMYKGIDYSEKYIERLQLIKSTLKNRS
jgi:hypothetical protein